MAQIDYIEIIRKLAEEMEKISCAECMKQRVEILGKFHSTLDVFRESKVLPPNIRDILMEGKTVLYNHYKDIMGAQIRLPGWLEDIEDELKKS